MKGPYTDAEIAAELENMRQEVVALKSAVETLQYQFKLRQHAGENDES